MLFAVSRALYRHGRAVIAIAVLVTLAGAATMIGSAAYRDLVALSLVGGTVLAFVGALVVLNVVGRRGPRALELSADCFTTPRHGGGLLMMASLLPMIGIGIAAAGIEATSGRHLILGSAGVVAGLILPIDFLLGVIRVYVTEPGRRAAIGTPAELDRLGAELPAPTPVPLAHRPVREPGITTAGVVIRVLLAVGCSPWTSRRGNWWVEMAARIIFGALVTSLASKVHPITWIRQRFAGKSPGAARPE